MKSISDLMTSYRVIDSVLKDDGSAAIVFQGPKGYALATWDMSDEKSKIPVVVRASGVLTVPAAYRENKFKIVIEKNKTYALPSQEFAVIGFSNTGNITLTVDGVQKWESQTHCGQCSLGIESSGNMTVFNKSSGHEYFSTAVHNSPNARLLAAHDEPYLRIGDSSGILWASSNRFEKLSLKSGQSVRIGSRSANPEVILRMSEDGFLRVISAFGKILWASSVDCPECWMLMQGGSGDGNLVLRSGADAKWSSQSWRHPGAALEISSTEPYLKIVDTTGVVWASSARFNQLTLRSGQSVNIGDSAAGPDGILSLSSDGNLSFSRYGNVLWSSQTSRAQGQYTAVLQTDGNFVLYDQKGLPYFDTGTEGPRNRGTTLKISTRQPYLQILDEKGVLWASSQSFNNFWLNPSQVINIGGNGRKPQMRLRNELSGELILYNVGTNSVLWRSGVNCGTGYFCYTNLHGEGGDGNLVVNAQPLRSGGGTPYAVFDTGTYDENQRKRDVLLNVSSAEPYMTMTDDTGIIWASSARFTSLALAQGKRIKIGRANTPSMTLYLEQNGNLTLYRGRNKELLWQSKTTGKCIERCLLRFQTDGNLVLYNGPVPIFATKTWGHPGAVLEFSQTAPFMRVKKAGEILWSSDK